LKKIMAFWFELGAAGFRVDMAGSLVKNDPDGRATGALWREFRDWMDATYPDCALVAEWSQPQISIPQGFHLDFLLPFAKPGYRALFRADPGRPAIFDRSGDTSFRLFLDEFEPLYAATKGLGFIAIPSGNHDTVPRLGNGRDSRDLAVAYAFLLTMPGVPFIYYGDEIGLRSQAGLPTKEGGYERTGARTPMQWDASANAGFSTAPAERLYLPLDPSPARPTVAAQLADPSSPLQILKSLIELRRAHPALGASGGFATLVAGDGLPCVFERALEGERVIVALNPAGSPSATRLPSQIDPAAFQVLAGESGAFRRDGEGWAVALPPVSYAVVLETG
jgi:maltose alpha-D-glucosyltransferase/alpha-amylase